MKYISSLSSDAAFAPYSTPSDLSWLTSSWLWARALLLDNQHPLSLPLSLASLQCECASELPNTHKSHLKAIFITCSFSLRKSLINQCLCPCHPRGCWQCWGQRTRSCTWKGKGKAREENWNRFCWWRGEKLKQVTGALSDQWCPCRFSILSPSGKILCLQSAWGRAEWCWGRSCASGLWAFLCSVPAELTDHFLNSLQLLRALLYSWRGCAGLGQVITRDWMSGAQLLVKLPKGPREIPFTCWSGPCGEAFFVQGCLTG